MLVAANFHLSRTVVRTSKKRAQSVKARRLGAIPPLCAGLTLAEMRTGGTHFPREFTVCNLQQPPGVSDSGPATFAKLFQAGVVPHLVPALFQLNCPICKRCDRTALGSIMPSISLSATTGRHGTRVALLSASLAVGAEP